MREDDATRAGAPARVAGLSRSAGDRHHHNVWGADHGWVAQHVPGHGQSDCQLLVGILGARHPVGRATVQ